MDCVIDALHKVVGAYTILATNGEVMVGVRDPRVPSAGARQVGQFVYSRERDLRAGYYRRGIYSRLSRAKWCSSRAKGCSRCAHSNR